MSEGNMAEALEELLHAAKVRHSLLRYYTLRRAVLSDPRHNVYGHFRAW